MSDVGTSKAFKGLNLNDDYLVVAAIDFGTTFSGYAFSFKTDPNSIKMNKNWGSTAGLSSLKAPSSVLTNPDGSFNSFGFDAEDEYVQHEPEENYEIYRCFKMILHNDDLTMDCTVESVRGHKRRAMDIFAMSLQFLKDHMVELIQQVTGTKLNSNEVRWVLTVPAIWSEKAKNFMRQAAKEGELIKEADDPALLIALEPEAASYYCRTMHISEFTGGTREPANSKFRAGDKLLVIDAGGGTVDITAHEILLNGDIKELYPASGGPWGGFNVNRKFFKAVSEILGEDFLAHVRTKSPQQVIEFGSKFEVTKKAISGSSNKKLRIELPHSFHVEFKKLKEVELPDAINNHKDEDVKFSNGYLQLDTGKAQGFFKESCEKTVKHVRKLLKKPEFCDLNYILLVGGYGQSPMLYEACRDAFSGKSKVLQPSDGQTAIVQGAVLYGHQPNVIAVRKAKATYGCQADMPFEEGKHDPSRQYLSKRDGKPRCRGTFKVFVEIGAELKNPEEVSFTVHPSTREEKRMTATILKSDQKNVLYVDDDGVSTLGKIKIKSRKGEYLGEDIKITVTFGHTEILVEATDTSKESGSLVKAFLDYS